MGYGAALAALVALACLGFASTLDAPTCSLSELAARESVLMSCDHSAPLGSAPMWCADPDGPLCLPALPEAPRPELWTQPDVSLPALPSLPRVGYAWMTWPQASVPDMPGRKTYQRIERPPRA